MLYNYNTEDLQKSQWEAKSKVYLQRNKQTNRVGLPVRQGAARQRLPKEGEKESDQVMVGVL